MDIEPHVQDEAEGMRAAKASFGAAMDANSRMTACGASPVGPNFFIDDLLNFPSESVEEEFCEDARDGLFTNPPVLLQDLPNFKGGESHPPGDGLCVPPDELILQLEWLSSFNEDDLFTASDSKILSFVPSSSQASCVNLSGCTESPATTTRRKPVETFNSHSPVSVLEQDSPSYAGSCVLSQVFKSYRSRKARAGRRIWSLDILKPVRSHNRIKDSVESRSLRMTSNTSAYSEPFCSLLQPDHVEKLFKKAKLFNVDAGPGQAMRRCSHCFVEKTPQWRAGPEGPKTLCNACGMRYKLGRLVPEYRPAASPTFSNEVHSNSHRRILEMRRAKAGKLFGKFIEKNMECEEESHSMDVKVGYDVSMEVTASGGIGENANRGQHLTGEERFDLHVSLY